MSNGPTRVFDLEVKVKERHTSPNTKVAQGVYTFKSGGHFTRTRVITEFFEWAVKHEFIDPRILEKHRDLNNLNKRAFI